MADVDVFGLPTTPVEEQEDFAWLNDEDPAVTSPTEPEEETPEVVEEAPETPEVVDDPALAGPAAKEAPQEAPEAPEEPAPYRWANKYNSPEELEKGYRDLRDLWRRTSEQARAYEQQNMEILARAQQLEATLQQAIPYVQQVAAQRQKPQVDDYGQPIPVQPPTPEQVAAFVRQQVQAETSQREAALRYEMQQRQEQQESVGAVMSFYEAHPEVEPRGDIDNDIAETIIALNDAWASRQSEFEVGSTEALEIAYEATKRPALRQVLELKPEYIDTDAGMQLARMEASILEGTPTTQASALIPASQVGKTSGQRKPAVERASGTSDGGGIDPTGDPWLEAVADYRNDSKRGSVFFE